MQLLIRQNNIHAGLSCLYSLLVPLQTVVLSDRLEWIAVNSRHVGVSAGFVDVNSNMRCIYSSSPQSEGLAISSSSGHFLWNRSSPQPERSFLAPGS